MMNLLTLVSLHFLDQPCRVTTDELCIIIKKGEKQGDLADRQLLVALQEVFHKLRDSRFEQKQNSVQDVTLPAQELQTPGILTMLCKMTRAAYQGQLPNIQAVNVC